MELRKMKTIKNVIEYIKKNTGVELTHKDSINMIIHPNGSKVFYAYINSYKDLSKLKKFSIDSDELIFFYDMGNKRIKVSF